MNGPAQRVADPRVQHLELWDAEIDGASLFAQRERDDYPTLVAAVAEREARARGLSAVYLGGGDPRLVEVAHALRGHGLTARVAPDPIFVAEPGARAWLDGAAAPLTVDAGQTSFKVVGPRGRRRVAREPAWQGEAGFVAALRRVVADAGPHDAAVVGLPCELDGDRALACSYFDRLDLDAVAASFRVPVRIATDAELAALSAIAEHPSGAMLVLTLGHGVGAAWVHG